MSQRYFLTAESTYEDLRQALNVLLQYPNALGKSVFQTALYAPRDNFRRVLLAVDTAIPGYATVNAAIQPLLDSDAMEEVDEATYLAAVASATGGGATFSTVTDTLTYTNFLPEGGSLATALSGIDSELTGIGAALSARPTTQSLADADTLSWRGSWSSSSTYGYGDVVRYAGQLWLLQGGDYSSPGGANDWVGLKAIAVSHAHSVTTDITAGNWKIFHSNGSGAIVELALGASGTVLTSNGTANAPTFQAVQGESFHPFLLAGM